MTYQVTARKWRPQTFAEVVGQEHITATLTNAIATGRIAHCYLFCGPRGVGKTTTARILAKALNCSDRRGTDPCQECPSCVSITDGTSMDVLEIDGASNNSVDDVRELREVVRYVPTAGSHKIYIIDEVHMLSTAAFNALLKTLEEPPERVVFVFATTEVQDVPDTILSRCQRFNFRRIPAGRIAEHLRMIADTEGISAEQEALYLLAQRADGALRDAESLMDQVASFEVKTRVAPEAVRRVLGLVDRSVYFDLSEALIHGDGDRVLDAIATAAEEGTDLEEFIKGYTEHVGQWLSVRVHGAADKLEIADVEKARFEELAPRLPEEDILRILKTLLELEAELRRSVQPRFRVEMTLVRLSRMGRSMEVGELLHKVRDMAGDGSRPPATARTSATEPPRRQTGVSRQVSPQQAEAAPASGSAAAPAAEAPGPEPRARRQVSPEGIGAAPASGDAPEAAVAAPALSLEAIRGCWEQVIDRLKQEQPSAASSLAEAQLHSLEGSTLKLLFTPEAGFPKSLVDKNRAAVEKALSTATGQTVRIRCESAEPPESAAGKAGESPAEHPKVRAVLDAFDGELV